MENVINPPRKPSSASASHAKNATAKASSFMPICTSAATSLLNARAAREPGSTRTAAKFTAAKSMRSATRKKTGRDPDYLKWIRTLPCVCCWVMVWGDFIEERASAWNQILAARNSHSEVMHVGCRGLSQKCRDRDTLPGCAHHHRLSLYSHHKLQKKFWIYWGIDRDALIAKLNKEYDSAAASSE